MDQKSSVLKEGESLKVRRDTDLPRGTKEKFCLLLSPRGICYLGSRVCGRLKTQTLSRQGTFLGKKTLKWLWSSLRLDTKMRDPGSCPLEMLAKDLELQVGKGF